MKIHLINKGVVTRYLNKHPKARKALSLWMTIMNHANWNDLSDIIQTFGLPQISKAEREVRFEVTKAHITVTCTYFFHPNRVHFLIRYIRTNEVQDNQVDGAV